MRDIFKRQNIAVLSLLLALAAVAAWQMQPGRPPTELLVRITRAYGGLKGLAFIPPQETREGIIIHFKPFRYVEHFSMRWRDGQFLKLTQCGALQEKVCLGKHGGWIDRGGAVTRMTAEQQTLRKAQEDEGLRSLILKLVTPGSGVKDLGWRSLPWGTRARVLRLPLSPGATQDFDVDPRTGLVIAIERSWRGLEGEQSTWIARYSDYRSMNANPRPRPWRQETYHNGALEKTVLLTHVDWQAPVPNSLFDPPAAAANRTTCAAPLDYSTGHPCVSVSVNGRQGLRFLVDTGADITRFSPTVAEELGLRFEGEIPGSMGFKPVKDRVAQVKTLQVGRALVTNLAVVVNDQSLVDAKSGRPLAGLLGYNFLGRFQVTLDYAAGQLTLAPLDSPLLTGKPIPMDVRQGIIWINARVESQRVEMALDTGAADIDLPPESARFIPRDRVRDGGFALGTGGHRVRKCATRVRELSVDGQAVRGLPAYFFRPEDVSAGYLTDVAGVLGNHFLEHFRITLDYTAQRLVLAPQPDPH